jgi:hypothetical protein
LRPAPIDGMVSGSAPEDKEEFAARPRRRSEFARPGGGAGEGGKETMAIDLQKTVDEGGARLTALRSFL